MKSLILILLAGSLLAGCGSGGSSTQTTTTAVPATTPVVAPPVITPPVVKIGPTDVVVIGNSITFSDVNPPVEWTGSWGMAASSADKDFTHLVASTLGIPLTAANNFAGLEFDWAGATDQIPAMTAQIKSTSLAVIEMGDDVSDLVSFVPRYNKLLDAAQHAQVLVCTSTWWQNDARDAVIQAACSAHGGHYVYIGNIYTDPLSGDKTDFQYPVAGVNRHPHDWSMARIAERIVAAAKN
jgi:alpha-galactosidase